MAIVYLGLGTNRGEKLQNLAAVVALLAERVGEVQALSRIYETEPWGFESDHLFLNAAARLQTHLSPLELLHATRAIEVEMGRTAKREGGYQDRVIDVDILMYDDRVIQTPELSIPHPLMHQRLFVMEPLTEIAPETIHPVLHQSIASLTGRIRNRE